MVPSERVRSNLTCAALRRRLGDGFRECSRRTAGAGRAASLVLQRIARPIWLRWYVAQRELSDWAPAERTTYLVQLPEAVKSDKSADGMGREGFEDVTARLPLLQPRITRPRTPRTT